MFAAEFTLCNIKLGGKSNSDVLTSVQLDLRRIRLKHSEIMASLHCYKKKEVLQIVKTTKAILTVESKVKIFSEYFFR